MVMAQAPREKLGGLAMDRHDDAKRHHPIERKGMGRPQLAPCVLRREP
jgi:hypothetical protein